MNIQPINNYNVSMQGASGNVPRWKKLLRKFEQKVLNIIPEKALKDSDTLVERLKKYDTFISKPAENRIIMGTTAILTQPAIDYYNHRVDEETRTVSSNRTIAKIIAGTTVGAIIRSAIFKIIDKMTNPNGNTKYAKKLLPEKYYDELVKNSKKLNNYKSALATIVALLVMSITNVVIDAPLTTFLSNKLNKKTQKPEEKESKPSLKEGIYA